MVLVGATVFDVGRNDLHVALVVVVTIPTVAVVTHNIGYDGGGRWNPVGRGDG